MTSCKGLASCSRMERGRAGRIPENQVHLAQVHLGQVEESRRAVNKCSGLRASGSAEQGGIICVQSSTTPHLPLPLPLSQPLLSPHIFFHNFPFPPRPARITTPSPRERRCLAAYGTCDGDGGEMGALTTHHGLMTEASNNEAPSR